MKLTLWKRKLCAAFACLNRKSVWISAGATLVLGIVIAASGTGRYPFIYCLPKGALSFFFVMIFWGLSYAALGAALGIFLFSDRCVHDRYRQQTLLLFIFALTLAYAWIPLVYKAGCLFFGLLTALLLLGALILLIRSLWKAVFLAAFLTVLCGIWAVYVSYYTFSLMLLNG